MTIKIDHETASTIEQIWASRIAEEEMHNDARLDNWHRRLPRDPVVVPAASAPAVWPIARGI